VAVGIAVVGDDRGGRVVGLHEHGAARLLRVRRCRPGEQRGGGERRDGGAGETEDLQVDS
jgi:hypothetical protein